MAGFIFTIYCTKIFVFRVIGLNEDYRAFLGCIVVIVHKRWFDSKCQSICFFVGRPRVAHRYFNYFRIKDVNILSLICTHLIKSYPQGDVRHIFRVWHLKSVLQFRWLFLYCKIYLCWIWANYDILVRGIDWYGHNRYRLIPFVTFQNPCRRHNEWRLMKLQSTIWTVVIRICLIHYRRRLFIYDVKHPLHQPFGAVALTVFAGIIISRYVIGSFRSRILRTEYT